MNISLVQLQLVLVCALLVVRGEGRADEAATDPNGEGSEAAALADLKAQFEHLSNKLEGLTVSKLLPGYYTSSSIGCSHS